MNIKNVPFDVAEKFKKQYGYDEKGNTIWDFEKVIQKFMKDIEG